MWSAVEWDDPGVGGYPGGVVLRDAAGRVLRVSLGPGDVDCRPYYVADPEDWIVKALVAAEDGEFWKHRGVRPLSVLRAFVQNVFRRRRISGASTITMQTVRLIRPHRKSYVDKLLEAVRALKLERRHDKLWILSQYLNRAPYGSNFVGIEAAANGWFGKSAKSLGLGEAALLAGMVQAPSRFRPDRGYEKAVKRRDYVLARMLRLGMITAEQLEGAKSVRPALCRAPRPFAAPCFCDWALRTLGVDRAAQRRSGDFVTTLDADVQALCERSVAAASEEHGYSVAAVVMKVDTAETLALAASGDYFAADGGQVNAAFAARSAGSTLKPFLSAFAMDRGLVGPDDLLADVPVAYGGYRPANFDGRYRGSVSLRDALVLSLNLPFVRLLDETGVEPFRTKLGELGFTRLGSGELGLGLAVGNAEVTLTELVAAYGALARGGVWHAPRALKDAPAGEGTRVFSPGAAYRVSEMLSGDERSDAALGHAADAAVPRFAWKTGTSSAFRDAWAVVWNPEYVVGVWCGHRAGGVGDETVVGAKAAAPVAWQIARALYPRNRGPWFAAPAELPPRAVRTAPETAAKAATGLRLLRPAEGDVFESVPGFPGQRLVCEVAGNAPSAKLWWFLDAAFVGESSGDGVFTTDLVPGGHTLTCSSADGRSASVRFSVR